MITAFRKYIEQYKLFEKQDDLLLAISGGVDSVVLFHLLLDEKYKFSIAHVNFQLRGNESDEDEAFVKALAKKHNIPCFSKKATLSNNKLYKGMSTQMAARAFRYQWFEEVLKKNSMKYLLTAHHQDDQAETILLNLSRGTGLAGLKGMLPKKNHIIRPLLFASKEEILKYAQKNKLEHREDSSNASLKYRRNHIRHVVLPELKRINNEAIRNIAHAASYMAEAEVFIKQGGEKIKNKLLKVKDGYWSLSIPLLLKEKAVFFCLNELLKDFGFHISIVKNIVDSFQNQSGKQFYSDTHRIIKDRSQLIIEPITNENRETFFLIDKKFNLIFNGKENDYQLLRVNFAIFKKPTSFLLSKDKSIAMLDYEKITFPLKIRKWQKGDTFYPLGMNGKKKLSDFFIDQKKSLREKENTWILTDTFENVLWVIGMRIDNRFKVTEKTKKILQITHD